MTSKQLRDIDIKILEEIERNEGSSKQSVVRALSMIRSRIPVLNSIDYLEAEELIIARMDKPNSQRYRLYINQGNMRAKLIKDLNTFKRCFIHLLDISQKQFDRWEIKIRKLDPGFYWDYMRKIMLIEENLLSGLFSIYLFVVNTFTIVGIVKWLNKTRDSEILSNMYFIIFQTMEHIQIRLHDLVSSLYAFGDETKEEIVTFMPKYSPKPDLKFFAYLLDLSKEYKLQEAMPPVIDILWKISLDLIPFSEYEDKIRLIKDKTDWKKILSMYNS